MGKLTENFQQLERTLTSEATKTSTKKQKKEELKNNLYHEFYNKFYTNKGNNPLNIYSYYNNPEIKQKRLNYKGTLTEIEKHEIYNRTLKSVYNDFKIYYQLEIDTTKTEEEEQKEHDNYLKALKKNRKLTEKKQETTKKLIFNIIISFIIGLLIPHKPSKRYKL